MMFCSIYEPNQLCHAAYFGKVKKEKRDFWEVNLSIGIHPVKQNSPRLLIHPSDWKTYQTKTNRGEEEDGLHFCVWVHIKFYITLHYSLIHSLNSFYSSTQLHRWISKRRRRERKSLPETRFFLHFLFNNNGWTELWWKAKNLRWRKHLYINTTCMQSST
jgi:hypothetical protein